MFRLLVRLLLVVALIISVAVVVVALYSLGLRDKEGWAAVAAALAVITSVIASWGAQRVLELQQDSQRPYPYPSIDVTSRYMLMQLVVKNLGGTAAYDIRLKWGKPVLNAEGEVARFTKQAEVPEIPILLPNESVAISLGASNALFERYQDMNYSGEVEFQDPTGKRMKHAFYVSAERYRNSLTFREEDLRTNHELQKIPAKLEALTSEVKKLREELLRKSGSNQEEE
jgi:hypothetical protein